MGNRYEAVRYNYHDNKHYLFSSPEHSCARKFTLITYLPVAMVSDFGAYIIHMCIPHNALGVDKKSHLGEFRSNTILILQ